MTRHALPNTRTSRSLVRRSGSLAFAAALLALPAAVQAQDDAAERTIAEVVAEDPRFSLLAHSASQAGMLETLEGEGPITLFAPTDAAWNAIGQERLEPYMRDPARLVSLLERHVVVGPVALTDRTEREIEVETLAGETITVDFGREPAEVGENARVVEADMQASNGVVHAIDDVLIDDEG